MLSSGIYGAFRLDSGPVDAADIRALGFAFPKGSSAAFVAGLDGTMPDVVHRCDDGGAVTLLVGELDDASALREQLALARESGAAALARAALLEYGSETPDQLAGEWSLLHWEPHGRLTLMSSSAARDRIYYAVSGPRCVVAPNLFQLSRVPWVGSDVDEAGYLFNLGRAELRAHRTDRTMVSGVTKLGPGASVVVTAGEVQHRGIDLMPPQPRFAGTFDEAMAEAEALLVGSVRARLGNTALPGLMLSGGLDSSVLACTLSDTRRERGWRSLTSVAPPGSGLPDESSFAAIVARELGCEMDGVHMGEEANMYRPTPAMIMGQSGALVVNRPWFLEAFHRVAHRHGVTMLCNGSYGELHYTGYATFATWRGRLRAAAKQQVPRWTGLVEREASPFHVRLSADRMAHLPAPVREAMRLPPRMHRQKRPGDQWDYPPGVLYALGKTNEFYPGALRMAHPFRDIRLMQLFAGFPMDFFKRDGFERAPARHYLNGRLPDTIRFRLQKPGLGAPDHLLRLKNDAPAARRRMAVFRRAGADEWLDLDWLDTALARVAAQGHANYTDANEVQITTLNAEMLAWWRGVG